MTSPNHTRSLTRLTLQVAAGVALLPAAALAGATPALAHDELVTAEPAPEATLTTAPSQASLTFSGDLIDGQGIKNLIQVRDAHGNQWQSAAGSVEGPTLSVPLCPGLPNGEYDVAYRVVYSDGHSEEASYGFTLADPAAPAAGTAPQGCGLAAGGAATAASSPSSAPSAAQDGAATRAEATPAEAPQVRPADDGLPGWVWPVGVGGVLVLLLGLLAMRGKARALQHLGADRTDAERPDAHR